MKTRTPVFLFLLGLVFSACGGQPGLDDQSIVQTSVAGTTIAGQTATSALLETAAARQTEMAPTATEPFTATLPPTDTPLATDTQFPTDTLTPTLTLTVATGGGGGSTTGCAQQCEGGGCHKFTVNNKTTQYATLNLYGPGTYCFSIPTGIGQKWSILPGYYTIHLEYCGGQVADFSHQLNSKWILNIEC